MNWVASVLGTKEKASTINDFDQFAEYEKSWFTNAFGFTEMKNNRVDFYNVKRKFELRGKGDQTVPIVKENGRKFAVGSFETPSVNELRKGHASVFLEPSNLSKQLGGITFENIIGESKSMHLDPKNAGAVFQAASQFNCLEMASPRVTPEDGVTRYENDHTQGPACAIACPAATVVRNYFAGAKFGRGQARGNQIDTTEDIAKLVDNKKYKYWKMSNGYLFPTHINALKELNKRSEGMKIAHGSTVTSLWDEIGSLLRVGVHWSTDTARKGKRSPHQVCQVFCSALPVGYSDAPSADFELFGSSILNGAYEATFAVGATIARLQNRRVTVYLTQVGGGVFANPHRWIVNAINRAILRWRHSPIDIKLVHYRHLTHRLYETVKVPGNSEIKEMVASEETDVISNNAEDDKERPDDLIIKANQQVLKEIRTSVKRL